MFEEIATISMAVALPFSGASGEVKKQVSYPMAIYSFHNESNLFNNQIYLSNDGNKYSLMNSLTQSNAKQYINDSEKLLSIFKNLIDDKIIDFDEDFEYFGFLSNIRSSGEKYEAFLRTAFLSRDAKTCSAISLFLSQKDYNFILSEEENFVLNVLQFADLQAQSFALNTVLNWNNISDINCIKNVKISNRYLQEDLEEFIAQRE